MDFKSWLAELTNQSNREDIIMDFAHDAKHDKGFPNGGHYKRYYRHLINKGACIEALKAFRQAWLEWIDEDLEKWELSWDIRAPRKPTGYFEALSGWDLLVCHENEAPNEPEYTEECLERAFRRGYFYGMSDTQDFLASGGITRQLMQWYEKLFQWRYKDLNRRVTPPPPPEPWNRVRRIVLNRDSNICVYCGVTDANQIDHIFPLKLGGSDDLKNLVRSCKPCNSQKSSKHPLEWYKSRRFLEQHQDVKRYLYEKYPEMGCNFIY